MAITIKKNRLYPLLKYPGGKEKELKYILPNLPDCIGNYYEPFVGGGAVYFAIDSQSYYINDKSTELINLYKMIKEQNKEFFKKVTDIEHNWTILEDFISKHTEYLVETYFSFKNKMITDVEMSDDITEFIIQNADEFNGLLNRSFNIVIDNFVSELMKSLKNKMNRMNKIEKEKGDLGLSDIISNIECACKNAFYMHFRYLYNHIQELNIDTPFATAIYYFIREYCYSSMFRYNRSGQFNVPYGGISYNKKSLDKKIQYLKNDELTDQLRRTIINNEDFEIFFKMHEPKADDFVFLDPPYDTEFSTYANNKFDKQDQERLSNFLIHKCKANFMLIIKNTEFIRQLYPSDIKTVNNKRLYISKFDKKYIVSFQDRNDKDAEHLLITNYPISR